MQQYQRYTKFAIVFIERNMLPLFVPEPEDTEVWEILKAACSSWHQLNFIERAPIKRVILPATPDTVQQYLLEE